MVHWLCFRSLTLKYIIMCLLWLLQGAAAVHFQDFNAEVLRCLTIPNLKANLSGESQPSSSNSTICDEAEVRFFAGDWSGIDKLLPHVTTDAKHNQGDGYDFILMAETVYSINSLQNLYNLIKKVFFCSQTRAKFYFYVDSLHFKLVHLSVYYNVYF